MRECRAHPNTVPFLPFLCLSSVLCLFFPLLFLGLSLAFSLVFSSFSALESRLGWQLSMVEESGYLGNPSLAAMALRATCSGIKITDYKQTT